MTRNTHLAAGILASLPIISEVGIADPISALGIVGSVFPDIDLKVGIKHRGITHTLYSLVFTTLAADILGNNFAIVWFFSYSSHLFLDSFTRRGIPLLSPFKKENIGLKICTTGKLLDHCIMCACHAGSIIYVLNKFNLFAK